ncbi:hypothetical protein PRIPAC_91081, partial [Pristionchus pacificus]
FRLAMRSLALLALLLFTMVAHSTVSARTPSSVPNRTLPFPHPPRSLRATTNLMQELLGPNGGKRTLKAFNGKYLTEFKAHWILMVWSNGAPEQYFYIEQINDNEVALKSATGWYITHWWFGQSSTARVAKEWEMLTPVKNNDGTWSFKSRWNKWMSAVYEENGVTSVTFEPKRYGPSENWLLE